MAAEPRNIQVLAVTLAAFLITMESTHNHASETTPPLGVIKVNVTHTDSDGTVRPLGGVELELECDRVAGFPRMLTDAKGRATIRALYSTCELTATSPVTNGGRGSLWYSHVEFSRKEASVDLSSENAILLPVLIRDVDAEQLAELRKAGAGSRVVVRTVVRTDGTVGPISVSGASSSKLERSVIAALRKRRYEPALQNGWPVEVSLTEHLKLGLPMESAIAVRGDESVRPTDGVVLPVIVTKVEPIYPPHLRLARVEGTVTIQAVIDEEGNVNEVTVLSSSNPLFNDSAIEAVKQRTYRPALKEEKPVSIYFTIKIDFRLR